MTTFDAGWFRPRWSLAAALVATALGAPALAQCTTQWQALAASPIPGLGSTFSTVAAWDPDGTGPLPARLVAGGGFPLVNSAPAGGIAVCDLATSAWSTLAGGTDGTVQAVLSLPNGDLVVAGPFNAAGGGNAQGIARWNGAVWSPLGAGLSRAAGVLNVTGLVALSNGDVVAAGNFLYAGGVPANGLARWDGNAWAAIPAALTGGNQQITALVALPNGELAVGGSFTAIAGVPAANVARWTGTSWLPFGAGFGNGNVTALAVTGNGGLVAAASPYTGGQVVSQWNGSTWQTLATQPATYVHLLVGLAGDGVAAAGTFSSIGGVAALRVAAWDGVAWSGFGAGPAGTNALVRGLTALPNGQLVALTDYGPTRWDGAAWRPLVVGPQYVVGLLAEPDGGMLAAGSFVTTNGPARLGRWNGTAWAGVDTPLDAIKAIARRANGNLVVGGAGVAEWDGSSWSPPGNENGAVNALLAMPNGDVVAGGDYLASVPGIVARWNGSTWSMLGNGLWGGAVRALALMPNGDVVAGGDFTDAGSIVVDHIARWNGTSWSPLGSGMNNRVWSLAVAPNGDLYAAGDFTMSGGIAAAKVARWNGTAWSPLPGLSIFQAYALAVLPNGDLVVGGHDYPGHVPSISRWDGANWTTLSTGLAGQPFGDIRAVAFGGDGLYAGGLLTSAGGQPSTAVARLASTCSAVALAWGSGCASRTLTASSPWLGSTLRTTGTGPLGSALAFLASGFGATSVPLSTVVSSAVPGCVLMVQPDHLAIVPFAGGQATVSMQLPSTAALAGIVMRQQMVALDLGGAFAATSSNALLLTLGAF